MKFHPTSLELIGKSSHAIFTHRLRIRPDRSYSVYAHLGPAVLAVVNRLEVALNIRINERPAGTVAAGATAEIPIQERGRITVYADQKESQRFPPVPGDSPYPQQQGDAHRHATRQCGRSGPGFQPSQPDQPIFVESPGFD